MWPTHMAEFSKQLIGQRLRSIAEQFIVHYKQRLSRDDSLTPLPSDPPALSTSES